VASNSWAGARRFPLAGEMNVFWHRLSRPVFTTTCPWPISSKAAASTASPLGQQAGGTIRMPARLHRDSVVEYPAPHGGRIQQPHAVALQPVGGNSSTRSK
jgi:hypothetical protein